MFLQERGWKKIPHLILDPVGVTCVVCCCSCLEVWRTVKPSSGSLENTPKRQPKDRGEAQPCSMSFSKFQAARERCLLLPFLPHPCFLWLLTQSRAHTCKVLACSRLSTLWVSQIQIQKKIYEKRNTAKSEFERRESPEMKVCYINKSFGLKFCQRRPA